MNSILVVGTLALFLAALFGWSFRCLPGERWQVLAALPRNRQADGVWRGVNLTYYGLFIAGGLSVAVAAAVFLSGTVGQPLWLLAWGIFALLAVGIPAASVFNRLVEGHWHGFTVGGAAFIGITAGPWMLWALARFAQAEAQATLFMLSALAPAYGLGEGIGRLGCLSYGCCYGRRLADCSPWLRALFSHWHFSFAGPLKKACYERGFQEERLIPIQGITAIVSSAAGLLGVALFLQGSFVLAYALPIGATQVWRFASEFLRADYRGQARISVYQWLALTAAASVVPVAFWWPDVPTSLPDVGAGFRQLWTPGALLLIQAVGAATFLRLGISTVTASRLIFELAKQPSRIDALSPRHLVQPASEHDLTLHAEDRSHLGQAPHAPPPPVSCISEVNRTINL